MKKLLKKLLSWQVMVAGLILALIGWGFSMYFTVVYGPPTKDFEKKNCSNQDTMGLQPELNPDSMSIKRDSMSRLKPRPAVYGPNPNLKRHDQKPAPSHVVKPNGRPAVYGPNPNLKSYE